jgi:hypothetical protein
MNKRIEWAKASPDAYKAMVGLEMALGKSGLDSSLLELLRSSTDALTASTCTPTMHARPVKPKLACRP